MNAVATLWSQILYALSNIRIFDLIDILAIAYIIYKAIELFRETRAGQLVKGIVILLIIYVFADWFELLTIKWLLLRLADSLIVVAAIIFQPELRRALESVGRSKLGMFARPSSIIENTDDLSHCIASVCKAVGNMQESKTGALIVFERKTGLGEIIDTGTQLDAKPSVELVQNVFYPKSPLHDGAMVIRGTRIVSAGCILPLTGDNTLSSQLGTRHRAAIGMSEVSDALVVVVSEETGNISVAQNGKIERNFNQISLMERLTENLVVVDETEKGFFAKLLDKISKKAKQ